MSGWRGGGTQSHAPVAGFLFCPGGHKTGVGVGDGTGVGVGVGLAVGVGPGRGVGVGVGVGSGLHSKLKCLFGFPKGLEGFGIWN